MVMPINDKLEYWKKCLLDLGKRNHLIYCPLPAEGKRIQRHSLIISQPTPMDVWGKLVEDDGCISFPNLEYIVTKDDCEAQLELFDVENVNNGGDSVVTNQTISEANKTLRSLMKKAKEYSEEKGLNALHLAFGFLHWKENGANGIDMRSPLLLLPVMLSQEDLFSPFVISQSDEEPSTNHSLKQKLLGDFNISLPEYSDDSGIENYFLAVSDSVKHMGWTVSNQNTQLSLFSFLKVNMYRDLERNASKICEHAIIRAINGESYPDGVDVTALSGYDHDSVDPSEVFSVVDSDSSQQDAILLAKRGASFVLQGPPGTGKSQTISNIIAELIADGKRVLFVSEKVAALEVVYKRLKQVGLDDFCLTLHSHNAKRREVIAQFERSIKISRNKMELQEDAAMTLYRLKESRAALNQYNKDLHTVILPLGKTIFQINGLLAGLEKHPNISFTLPDANTFTPESLANCEIVLDELSRIVKSSGYQQSNLWSGCVLSSLSYEFRQSFTVNADVVDSLISEGQRYLSEANRLLGTNQDWSFSNIPLLVKFHCVAKQSPSLPPSWINLNLYDVLVSLEKCEEAISLQTELSDLNGKAGILKLSFENEKQKQDDAYKLWHAAHSELVSDTDDSVLSINANKYAILYRDNYRTFFRGFIAGYRKAHKMLLSYRKTPDKLTYVEELKLLERIINVQNLKLKIDKQTIVVKEAERLLNVTIAAIKECSFNLAALHFEENCNKVGTLLGVELCASTDFSALIKKIKWAEQFKPFSHLVDQSCFESICSADPQLLNP